MTMMYIQRQSFRQLLETDVSRGLLGHGKTPISRTLPLDLNGERIQIRQTTEEYGKLVNLIMMKLHLLGCILIE